MKSYKEVANNVFERAEQYENKKRAKREFLTRTLAPICCICLAALLGIGLWQGGVFEKKPLQMSEDAITPGTKDWYDPNEEELPSDTSENEHKSAMKLIYNGKRYLQNTAATYENVVLDKKIGNGEDFEGTYNSIYLNKIYGNYTVDGDTIRITITSEVFTVKDNPNLLCVKLSNGKTDFLESRE